MVPAKDGPSGAYLRRKRDLKCQEEQVVAKSEWNHFQQILLKEIAVASHPDGPPHLLNNQTQPHCDEP